MPANKQDFRCEMRDARFEMRDAGYGIRDTGYGIRDARCEMRDTRYAALCDPASKRFLGEHLESGIYRAGGLFSKQKDIIK